MRICVCTTNAGMAEPRAPRHAVALAKANNEHSITFVDSLPIGRIPVSPPEFHGLNIRHMTCFYPHRGGGIPKLLISKLQTCMSRFIFQVTGRISARGVSHLAGEFESKIEKIEADVYIGHNIDTLLPLTSLAQRRKAVLIFDSMEYHADMGDGQTGTEREIVKALQAECLPQCDLVLTSSPELAAALEAAYPVRRILSLYNVPAKVPSLSNRRQPGLSLYWRNSRIGLGQRGLDTVLSALKLLPDPITLHLQGVLPPDRGAELRRRIDELGISDRVNIYAPFVPHQAVSAAMGYHIGLCLEHGGIRNHELTVSNKIFDYMMAGLAVIASDLPGLRTVLEKSGGGLLFKPGDPEDLRQKILTLYDQPELLRNKSDNAKAFALSEGHLDAEMKKFNRIFSATLETRAASVRGILQCAAS
jgi:glycosyltransferase involved in cell wall biosynthesis